MEAAKKAYWKTLTDDDLRQWCEEYLSPRKWRSLSSTIRSARYRERRHLSNDAYYTLLAYSEKHDISLSEAILKLCAMAENLEP